MSDEDLPDWLKRRLRRDRQRDWLFGDLDDIIRDMEEMMNQQLKEFTTRLPKDLVREHKLPDGSTTKEFGPFVYGYSMTIGPDGKPQIREFGNVKPSTSPERESFGTRRPRLDVKEEREPLVDVINTDGEVKVVVELPGVEKEDIKLYGTEKTLTISVDKPQRKYYKEIDLPALVDSKTAKSNYKNGVLEVTLTKKKEQKKPKGEPIEV
ncbi:MAG TPA: archaeal heat shock protein Hsp20 [Acidobacteriota bacterium]|nr:archaeal heat shock protein Hsp20 [Acidobacteriota bacterium]